MRFRMYYHYKTDDLRQVILFRKEDIQRFLEEIGEVYVIPVSLYQEETINGSLVKEKIAISNDVMKYAYQNRDEESVYNERRVVIEY